MDNSSNKPSCAVQHSATNPNGQRSTMESTTFGTKEPAHPELNQTKKIAINPTSTIWHRSLEAGGK